MPVVSIILPTYNRADLLPDALGCVAAQTLKDWELIIVDDGSTDDTRAVVERFAKQTTNPVRYIYQTNQGCGAARHLGTQEARGEFVAFFDSDDLGLAHHLHDCVDVMRRHPEVDWVYSDSRNVEASTGKVLSTTIFSDGNGRRQPFTRLRCRTEGKLHIFDDPGLVRCAIDHGAWAKLQASVLRRSVFDKVHVPPFRLADDVAFELMALCSGVQAAYLDDVHIEYRLYESSASTPLGIANLEKRIEKFHGIYRSIEYVHQRAPMKPGEDRAMRRRLADMQFFALGYAMHWMNGHPREALESYRRAMRLYPWDWRYWKTYVIARVKYGLGAFPQPTPQGTHTP